MEEGCHGRNQPFVGVKLRGAEHPTLRSHPGFHLPRWLPGPLPVRPDPDELLPQEGGHIRVAILNIRAGILQGDRGQIFHLPATKTGRLTGLPGGRRRCPQPSPGPLCCLSIPHSPPASVIVAEKSMVWRWWEHILMISFICSSKYSSSILANRGGKEVNKNGLGLHLYRRSTENIRQVMFSIITSYVSGCSISFYECYFILLRRFTIWPHLPNLFLCRIICFSVAGITTLDPKYFSTCSLRTRILSYTDTMRLLAEISPGTWHFTGVTP